jgi:hypothetical protein
MMQLLMQAGAHVDAVADDDWTPLHLACQGGRFKTSKLTK